MSSRWRAIAEAGHTGDHSVLHAALGDDDPVVRQLALGGLARCGAPMHEVLTSALTDPEPAVRRRAAQLAARWPSVELRGVLADPDATVVEMAAWSCGEHEHVADDVLATLIDMAVGAPDALVREAAVAALGAIGDERALDAVLHGTSDKPAVRRRAALALAAFDDDRAVTALRLAATDRDWQVRQAADDVLRAIEGL